MPECDSQKPLLLATIRSLAGQEIAKGYIAAESLDGYPQAIEIKDRASIELMTEAPAEVEDRRYHLSWYSFFKSGGTDGVSCLAASRDF